MAGGAGGNVTITAEHLFFLEFMGIRDEETTIGIMSELLAQQRPDGLWSIYHGGEPDLNATMEAYAALRLAGLSNRAPQLAEAAQTIRRWCRYVLSRQLADPHGWELQNMLTVASLMTSAALEREETRGVHMRIDYPDTNDSAWRKHLCVVRPESG